MRKIIVYIATSADGYIARADGSVDWLNRLPSTRDQNRGMGKFLETIDTILWGRKTWGPGANGFGPDVKNYVLTRTPPKAESHGAEFVNEPIASFASRLRAQPGKDIWIMGGAGIIASFLDAGEIDEFIIHVAPTFIGEGIPLIAPRHRSIQLKLRSVHSYSNGLVRLHYDVVRQKSRTKKSAGKATRKRARAQS
jgi:dihydrofolate reductase